MTDVMTLSEAGIAAFYLTACIGLSVLVAARVAARLGENDRLER